MSSSSEDEVPTKEEKVSIDEEEESVEEEEVSTEKEEVTTEKQKVSTEKEEDPRDLWIPKGIIMTDAFQKYCMHFFGKSEAQRTAELYDQCDRCMGGLDNIPEDWRQSDHERAMYAYFQGKMLAALPVYKKEAETFLWEAIHLDSDIWDAWRCLCNCFIKKGDLIRARNCANFPLNRKGPEKESLCQLSYILRMLAQDDEKPLELIDKSIKKAHEAINLDENDGFSWYTLGGAYLAYFFQTGECEFNQLLLSLTAYEMAMKDRIWQTYPNLVYDIAVIKQRDQVTLLEPYCKFVDFKWEEKHYKFKAVRVNRLDQILVNGNALLRPELLLHQPLRIKPKA